MLFFLDQKEQNIQKITHLGIMLIQKIFGYIILLQEFITNF